MQVFSKTVVLTTKLHIDAIRSLYIKARLAGEDNAFRENTHLCYLKRTKQEKGEIFKHTNWTYINKIAFNCLKRKLNKNKVYTLCKSNKPLITYGLINTSHP